MKSRSINLDFSTHADENTNEDMDVPTEKDVSSSVSLLLPKESQEAERNDSLKLLSTRNDCKSLQV
jgi:hypothetical protein